MDNPWNLLYHLQHEQNALKEKYDGLQDIIEKLLNALKESEMFKMKRIQTKKNIRCKFYNRGYCREEAECEFAHNFEKCQQFLKTGVCSERTSCQKRHPRRCRYWQEGNCWRGLSCVYQHDQSDFNTKKKPSNLNFEEKEDSPINEEVNIELIEDEKDDDNEENLNSEDEESCAITTDEILRMYEDIPDESFVAGPTTEEILRMYEDTNDENIVEDIYKLKKSTKMRQTMKI